MDTSFIHTYALPGMACLIVPTPAAADGMYVCGFQGTDIEAHENHPPRHHQITYRHSSDDSYTQTIAFPHTYIVIWIRSRRSARVVPFHGMPGFYGIDCISTCNTFIHIYAYIHTH